MENVTIIITYSNNHCDLECKWKPELSHYYVKSIDLFKTMSFIAETINNDYRLGCIFVVA